jgi:hypothetical protein
VEVKEIIRREIYTRWGRENAIRARDLARLAGVPQRSIADLTLELQLEGFRVVPSREEPYGYFYAIDDRDIEIYLAQLISFRRELSKRIDAVRRLLPKPEPVQPVQEEMFDEARTSNRAA